VRCVSDDGRVSGLRNLCHCISRPLVSGDRVRCNAAVQRVLHIETFLCEVATKLESSRLKFLRRQVALWLKPPPLAAHHKVSQSNGSSKAPDSATRSTATGRYRQSR